MARCLRGIAVIVVSGLLACPPVGAEESVPSLVLSPADSSGDDEGASAEADSAQRLQLSMEFEGAKLGDVLKAFSQQTGINVIAGTEITDRPITVYLEDVEVLDALDQILSAGNLVYERPPGSSIYIVKPKPEEAAARTMTRVYRLKYARVSESTLARAASSFAERTPYEATLGPAPGQAGGGTTGAAGGAGAGGQKTGIDVTVGKLLTESGMLVVDPRTNSLILTDVPGNFPRLEAAIAALDVRTRQIMVGAEVIETTLSKLKDLGLKWGGSTGQVLKLTPGSRKTSFPFGRFGMGEGVEPSGSTPFSVSTLDAVGFEGILQALESDTDTKILARPKVLTLDNESAVIRLTADEAIGFQTTTGEQTATTTSEPERTITGVVLVVTPQINEADNITMIVEPSVTKTVASKITPPSGQATPRDPKTRSSRTLVRIRSGDTFVVGGLIDRSDTETLRRVPFLSEIPFLGEAFKHTAVDNSESELVVFITPSILTEGSEAQVALVDHAPSPAREQEVSPSRQELIEQTLNRFEPPQLQ